MYIRKLFAIILAALLIIASLSALAEEIPTPEGDDNHISIGATAVPHEEIIEGVVRAKLEAAGWEVEVVPFTDYVLPNTSLEDGEIDANYFQTWRYLVEQNETRGLHLVEVLGIHLEPMGLYGAAYSSIDEIPEGASIAVPNDGSNESRALKLLHDNGIITLGETDDLYDLSNISENPKGIEFVELAAEQITHSLEDVNAAVINGNYALEAGLNPAEDALVIESADSDESYKYINYLVVKAGNEETAKTKALIAAFANQDVVDFINATYRKRFSLVPFHHSHGPGNPVDPGHRRQGHRYPRRHRAADHLRHTFCGAGHRIRLPRGGSRSD